MAKIANDNCKKIYITDDNPRNENPKKIRNELLKHIQKHKSFNIGNRKLAIKKAIQNGCNGNYYSKKIRWLRPRHYKL